MLRRLIEICVRRRVPALAATAGIAIYGVNAYLSLPVEAYPDVSNVQVVVIAQLPGQGPEEIERQVTVPIERVLNGTPGSIRMYSESLFGLSLVKLTFDDDADSFKCRALINERLAEADLPEGTNVKLAPEATPLGEIYQFRVVSDRHSYTETRSELEWTISRILLQVPGVADVVTFGGFLKEVHVEVDPERLLAHQLSLSDVTDALSKSNRNVGGGFLDHGEQQLAIRSVGYIRGPDDIGRVVLKSENGTPLRLGDISRLVLSHAPRFGGVAYNTDGEVAEGFALLRRGENPSVVLDGIHQKVKELNDSILPKGMQIRPFYDRTDLVSETLRTVNHNLIFGALLVIAIVWLFLRSLRASLIVASVIPLALLTAFVGLQLIHLPANLISMGAVDFGILVDGAVVLVENVLHDAHRKQPQRRRELLHMIVHSAVDVSRPTFFAMAIIIAALIPVFTLQRVEGRIFRPLALTYSFALLGALVFALTLVPALCGVVLRPRDGEVNEPTLVVKLRTAHSRLLGWLFARRVVVFSGVAALLLAVGLCASRLGTEFLPELDEGDIVIFVEMPPSIGLARGAEVLTEVRRRLMAFPEVLETLSEQGRPEDGTDDETVNMSETFVHVAPREVWRRGMTKDRLYDEMRASLTQIPGVTYNFSGPIKDNVEDAVSGVRGQVVLKIFGTDLSVMKNTLEQCLGVIGKIRGVTDLELYRDASVPQLQIELDRNALARAGISISSAQDVVQTALSGLVATTYWENERPVPVRVIFPKDERIDEMRISNVLVPAPNGARVPLKDVATIQQVAGRANMTREGNSRFLALKVNVQGRDLGSVVTDGMAAVNREVKVPEGNYLVWGGEYENQKRALARLAVIIPISFLVVFVLLYMALGSLAAALSVLVVAPLAMSGGVFGLSITHIPLSVSAAVGFIALLGQVCLASLLVVSAVEQRRRQGESLLAALIDGVASRFRMVLMTALLAILGLLPAALSNGVGSETQRPFAVVIITGLVTAVAITLLVLPFVYAAIAGRRPVATSDEVD
jgi:cobalt-zinc-cadmium resistance protein CzcA